MDPKTPNLTGLASEAAAENEPATVPLRDRSGEPYKGKGGPVTISVLGEYSTEVRKVQETNLRRLLKTRSETVTPETAEENRIRVALAGLVGWTLEDADGQPVPFTPENVRAVFKLAPWILDQVDEERRRHASFFASSSPR